VSEHRAIIAALAKGDAAGARAVMDEHLEAVAGRALIVTRQPKGRDLKDILALYSGAGTASAEPRKAARAER
jgi:hypothetical protein